MTHARWILALTIGVMLAALPACTQKKTPAAPPAPPPTYRGPAFLRGTIGSLVSLNGYESVLVSGYGLVVGLDHTGSADVPPILRDRFLNDLARGGFGRSEAGFRNLSPLEVLNSDQTAIVKVEGVIPPGATKNSRFDLRVEALPETQTTSLANGTLYTTELAIGGIDLSTPVDRPIARGRGQIFLSPFDKTPDPQRRIEQDRIGTVLAGGQATADMPLQLVLTQPSYRMSRMISDRINARYPQQRQDPDPIAVPQSDTIIRINIPQRHADNPQRLLDLLSHLYLDPTSEFAVEQAQRLADVLRDPSNHQYADTIAYAWEGMGRTIVPILQSMYTDEQLPVRLAALAAGSRLDDATSAEPLYATARGEHGVHAETAAVLLGELVQRRGDNVRAIVMLRELLDDEDPWVRVAAFEALAAVEDSTVRRFAFDNKCEIAHVRCKTPMIYVAREGRPRLVIFNDTLSFKAPLLFRAMDGRFMLRRDEQDPQLAVFWRGTDRSRSRQEQIPATLGYLAGLMAYKADADSRSPGLDMSYSQIVGVMQELSASGAVDAPFVLQRSRLEERIARGRIATAAMVRPDTADPAPADPPDPGAGEATGPRPPAGVAP